MMQDTTYLPWVLGAVLVMLLVWLAWRRPNRKRLVVRVLASILAGLSLICIAFPPAYNKTTDPTTAVLLTDGSSADSLEALLDANQEGLSVYSYRTKAKAAEPVTSLYTLLNQQPQLKTVHLLGNGLTTPELDVLKDVTIVPHLTAPPAGLTSIHWPAEITLGKQVAVSGQYRLISDEDATLYFAAAGKLQDSVKLKKGLQSFQLSFTPKQEGRFVYQIVAGTGSTIDTLGQVPVQVQPVEKLRILLFSATPSFEFKFLKNHLDDLQHQVALRSNVSKGITQSEWVNMPQTNLSRIKPSLLNQFDLVITEPEALQALSATERKVLEQAVTSTGLGVLTIRDATQPARAISFFTGFDTKQVSRQDIRPVNVTWEQRKQTTINALPYTFTKEDELIGLVQEKEDSYLAAARTEGWGTVAVSLIPQTFSWQLEGKQEVYASYWAHLLTSIARKKVQEKFWQVKQNQVPKLQQPLTLAYTDYKLLGKLPEASVRSITDSAATRLVMQQDLYMPEQYIVTYWPQKTGWHTVETQSASEFYFYVQDSLDWQYQEVQEKRLATQTFAAQQQEVTASEKLLTTRAHVPVYWFFLLFVLSSGFLWLEEKL